MGKTRSSFVWTRSTFVQFQVFWRDRSYLSFIKQVIFTIIDIMSWSRFIAFFLKVFKSLVELDDCKSLTFNNTQKICFWLFLSTMFCLFFSVTSSDFLHGLARFRFFFNFPSVTALPIPTKFFAVLPAADKNHFFQLFF